MPDKVKDDLTDSPCWTTVKDDPLQAFTLAAKSQVHSLPYRATNHKHKPKGIRVVVLSPAIAGAKERIFVGEVVEHGQALRGA